MNNLIRGVISLSLIFSIFTPVCAAKRIPPKPVDPVIVAGIRYSACGNGREQSVCAEEVGTGKRLWEVKISHVFIKPWMEEDNQWIFITNLKSQGRALLVRDERARCHALNIDTRAVRKVSCSVFTPEELSGSMTRR